MAKLLPICSTTTTLLLLLLLLTTTTIASSSKEPDQFVKTHNPAPKLLHEKLSHLHFYWHDTLSGRNPTTVRVARAPSMNKSATDFGSMYVFDDPLTVGPELSSKLVGRAEGMYLSASQEVVGLMMALNFAFMEGKYNGSTVTVLGRNTVLSKVREMPVIGGSGLFRWARGYAQERTHKVDLKTGDAIVEYNVFVMHY